MAGIKIIRGDLKNLKHIEDIIFILEHYKKDPMGAYPPLNPQNKTNLVNKFKTHPNVHVILAYKSNNPIGGSVCFDTFSTFSTRSVINIHDICVLNEYRGLGVGRLLMNEIIHLGKTLDSSKITLEVRNDNQVAMELYSSLGFRDATPPMYFWVKEL